MYISRVKGENILSCVHLSKICHIITNFLELNQKVGQEDITFPTRQVQEPLSGKKNPI